MKAKSLEGYASGGLVGGLIDALGILLDGIVVTAAHRVAQIAHLVHPAALVPGSRIDRRDRRGQPRATVGDYQLQVLAPQSSAIQSLSNPSQDAWLSLLARTKANSSRRPSVRTP